MAWSKQLPLESQLLRVREWRGGAVNFYESRGVLHQTLLIIQQTYGSRSDAQYMFRRKNTCLVICMFPRFDMMACRQLLNNKILENGNLIKLNCLTFSRNLIFYHEDLILKSIHKQVPNVLLIEFPKINV